MKALILAGGFGTRLKSVVSNVPKPMASIEGKPFLEHQIRYLVNQGIKNIVLAVGYKSEIIKNYFGDGMRFDAKIVYSEEDTPLGTGGAIRLAKKYLGDDPFLVLNGDSFCDVSLDKLRKFHLSKEGTCSMVLSNTKNSQHYGSVTLDGDEIMGFEEKSSLSNPLINSGIYLFSPKIFSYISEGRKISLEQEIFPKLAKAGEISGLIHDGYFIDIGRPKTYCQFKEDFLKRLQISPNISVSNALKRMEEIGEDILYATDETGVLKGVFTNNIFRRHLVSGGGLDSQVSKVMEEPAIVASIEDKEEEIQRKLLKGPNRLPILDKGRLCGIRYRSEEISQKVYPTIRGKTPLRISFAGGGTDMPHFYNEHGGVVISTTIDKCCYISAKKRADSTLTINSDMRDGEIVLNIKDLKYDGNFDLVKAVCNLISPKSGMDLYLNNDVPPGRGLGSSASFAILLAKIIGRLDGEEFDNEKLAQIAYLAETQELGIKGGMQDQYAAAYGGFNWIELEKGNCIINTLRINNNTLNELRAHSTLCYTGGHHESACQQEKFIEKYKENQYEAIERLKTIKNNSINVKKCLLSSRPNFQRIGELIHQSWQKKKELSPVVSNPTIDTLYDIGLQNGAYGGKLLGSGGGGYILFLHPPKVKNSLERALKNKGGEILNFNFDDTGAQIWRGE